MDAISVIVTFLASKSGRSGDSRPCMFEGSLNMRKLRVSGKKTENDTRRYSKIPRVFIFEPTWDGALFGGLV